ncbi:hypothetical protein EDC01DRAFT_654043 [Geopyxis carbonaria]|nr:hypothetical protein EDC01DRAFT_654043 [Geopyxis carbonaria]
MFFGTQHPIYIAFKHQACMHAARAVYIPDSSKIRIRSQCRIQYMSIPSSSTMITVTVTITTPSPPCQIVYAYIHAYNWLPDNADVVPSCCKLHARIRTREKPKKKTTSVSLHPKLNVHVFFLHFSAQHWANLVDAGLDSRGSTAAVPNHSAAPAPRWCRWLHTYIAVVRTRSTVVHKYLMLSRRCIWIGAAHADTLRLALSDLVFFRPCFGPGRNNCAADAGWRLRTHHARAPATAGPSDTRPTKSHAH